MSDPGGAVDHRHLRAARAILGFSILQASERLGVSVSSIVRAERPDIAIDHGLNGRVRAGYEQFGLTFLTASGVVGISLSDP